MSYTITYTNGTILTQVADQSEDSISTSLTLVGKNYSGYGSAINNNFAHLLENFANTTSPVSPMEGQLWYNSLIGTINVYTNDTWKTVGAPIASATQPASLVNGDFWFDTSNNQLWYYNGITLLNPGKPYGDTSGKTGALSETVIDATNIARNITSIYDSGNLIAWFSDRQIQLNTASNALYVASTGTIQPGLTLNPVISGIKIWGNATSADTVGNFSLGTVLFNNVPGATTATFAVNNDTGFYVGSNDNLAITIQNTSTTIIKEMIGQGKIIFAANTQSSNTTATTLSPYDFVGLTIDGSSNGVGINTDEITSGYTLDVEGSTLINTPVGTASLVVSQGVTFSQASPGQADPTLQINIAQPYLNIGTAYAASQLTNDYESGIVLTNSKNNGVYWLYNNAQSQWHTSVPKLSIDSGANGAGLYMDGQPILTWIGGSVQIGNIVTSAVGIQSLSGLQDLSIGTGTNYIEIGSDTITATNILYFKPGDYIDLNNSQIQNMKSTQSSDSANVATTKDYVDNNILAATGGFGGRKPYVFSLDCTGFTNTNAQVLAYVQTVLPVDGGDIVYYAQPSGARCNVLCATYSANSSTFTLNIDQNQIPAEYFVLSTGTSTVTLGTGTSTAIVVTSTTFTTATTLVTSVAGTVTVTGPLPTVTYVTKQYQVISISTATAVSGNAFYESNSGTTLTLDDATSIVSGAVLSGNGYTSDQLVLEVLSTTTVITNRGPDSTPSVGGQISFTTTPGFNDWVYIKDIPLV